MAISISFEIETLVPGQEILGWCNYDVQQVLALLRNLQVHIKHLLGFVLCDVNSRSTIKEFPQTSKHLHV